MVKREIEFTRRGLAAATLLLMACASGASGADKAATYTVEINQMRYGAVPGSLKVGDTIVWVNKDTVQHTVTAKDHSFDLRIQPGKQAQQTLAAAGVIPFYCVLHPTMRGVLKVAD